MPTARVAFLQRRDLFARSKLNSRIKPDNALRDGWDVTAAASTPTPTSPPSTATFHG
jgi:hypothetical protein